MPDAGKRPPRDNLFRGVQPFEFRRATVDVEGEQKADDGHLVGRFAVFDTWTEIHSWVEGDFLERFARGAFKKTLREGRDSIRVLFQHGRDPQIGDKPLGVIEALAEDDQGAAYDVRLLDTSYNRDLIPGLETGQYGASFRFSALREDWIQEPKRSSYNPDRLPERTVTEARVMEFGPVTFPAYATASAGIRSLTDDMLVRLFARDPQRVRELLGIAPGPESPAADGGASPAIAPPADAALAGTSGQGRRDEPGIRPLVVTRNPNRRRDRAS